jgi:copper chaperone
MDKLVIQASNIKCGGCVSAVENGLKEMAGITHVTVDIPTNKVTVKGAELDQAAIEAKLGELGYPAV